jgi:hypothetical protein
MFVYPIRSLVLPSRIGKPDAYIIPIGSVMSDAHVAGVLTIALSEFGDKSPPDFSSALKAPR